MIRFDIADVLEIDAHRFHNKNTPVRWNFPEGEVGNAMYKVALNSHMEGIIKSTLYDLVGATGALKNGRISRDVCDAYLQARKSRFRMYCAAGNRSSRRWMQELERLHNELTGFYEFDFEDESIEEEEF